ncbi:hydroxylysine kinase-like [Acanthaster planci]|uniref:Hydroxylysine kinase n=1 Tax=Acanthaster planci TaxID=133434 RepID=A0A8B7Y3G9_ACAPL|nr:hydroxylysine kinase-like [Acanthaster planci]
MYHSAINCDSNAGNFVSKPFLSHNMAGDLLGRLYGIEAKRLRELPSYYDQNFYVRVLGEDGRGGKDCGKFVLKVINGDESEQQAGCYQEIVRVLCSLQGEDGVAYPMPLKNLQGGYLSLQRFHRRSDGAQGLFLILLLSYVPGTVLSDVELTNQDLYGVGRAVASLNKKLLEYKGPVDRLKERANTCKWCLTSVAEVKRFIDGVPDAEQRSLAGSVLDRFLREVKPMEKTMRKGLIHTDMNRGNILAQPSLGPINEKLGTNDVKPTIHQSVSHIVSGIIDFNDMALECLVYDVAGSLMDIMLGCKDKQPLVAGGHFLAGYTSVVQLTRMEWQSLYVSTAARLVQILVLSLDDFRQSNQSNEYIMRFERAGGWEMLKELWETPQQKVEALWEELSINRH